MAPIIPALMEKEQATHLDLPQESYYAVQHASTGADCFPIFKTQEFQQRIVLMLKASIDKLLFEPVRGLRKVAERKPFRACFSAFGVS